MDQARNNWTMEEISSIYYQPLIELIYQAATIHRKYHNSRQVQLCTLINIKSGGCPENCSYCPQSSHYNTGVKAEAMMSIEEVVKRAKEAKAAGSTRLCMGAAWREVRDSPSFDRVLEMVKQVSQLDMEVCCCLGMLNESQAKRLKEAGIYAYNHNLDTSEKHYKNIITTRSYQDRLDTLEAVRKADISVCCGGIIGLGDNDQDRIDMIHTLATMSEHPDSVPINALVPVKGTPLENQEKVKIWDILRMIATARITMPYAMVRLSAGRVNMSSAEQALCFIAGANSIFTGEKLLTTPNPGFDEDKELLDLLGLKGMPSDKDVSPKKIDLEKSVCNSHSCSCHH